MIYTIIFLSQNVLKKKTNKIIYNYLILSKYTKNYHKLYIHLNIKGLIFIACKQTRYFCRYYINSPK